MIRQPEKQLLGALAVAMTALVFNAPRATLFAQEHTHGEAAKAPAAQSGCCSGMPHDAKHSKASEPGNASEHGNAAMHADDMALVHALFAHRAQIVRTVTRQADGVITLTESSDSEVARTIQQHAQAMLGRVKEARPIHRRDPLFRELLKYADRIVATYELTPSGIRVVETSTDPYVVKLIQAHADVVSAFIANGHAEMMTNHPLP
jgi:hypothetical protein